MKDCVTGGLEGVAMAIWPVSLVIIAAVFTYNLCIATGSMEKIKKVLTGVSKDRRILLLLIGWGFGGFLEGMAGFGTAVAIPAGILCGLGFSPVLATVACLVANATPTAFGSVGIPTVTLAQLTGISQGSLAWDTAVQLLPLILITPFVMVIIEGLKRNLADRTGIRNCICSTGTSGSKIPGSRASGYHWFGMFDGSDDPDGKEKEPETGYTVSDRG